MKSYRIEVLTLVLFLVSCGDKEDKAATKEVDVGKLSALKFLSTEQMASGNVLPFTTDELKEAVAADTYLYSIDPVSEGSDSCIGTTLNKIVAETTETEVTFKGEGNLDICVNDKTTGIVSGSYKFSFGIGCSGANTAPYVGKNFQEFGAMPDTLCEDGKSALAIFNIEANYSVDGGNGSITDFKFLSTLASSDTFEPCMKTSSGGVSTIDNCAYTDKMVRVSLSGASGAKTLVGDTVSFSKAKFIKATEDESLESTSFFTSGSAEIKFNNWEGTAKFYGAKIQPTWSMSDGSQETSGTYGQPINLTLLDGNVRSWLKFPRSK